MSHVLRIPNEMRCYLYHLSDDPELIQLDRLMCTSSSISIPNNWSQIVWRMTHFVPRNQFMMYTDILSFSQSYTDTNTNTQISSVDKKYFRSKIQDMPVMSVKKQGDSSIMDYDENDIFDLSPVPITCFPLKYGVDLVSTRKQPSKRKIDRQFELPEKLSLQKVLKNEFQDKIVFSDNVLKQSNTVVLESARKQVKKVRI